MTKSGDLVRADSELLPRLLALLPPDAEEASGADDSSSQRTDPESRQRVDELLARIVWSRLVEPGDAVAGILLEAFGPLRALDLLSTRADPASVQRALEERLGADSSDASAGAAPGIGASRIASGFERWLPRLHRGATLADLDTAAGSGMQLVLPGSRSWPNGLYGLDAHAPLLLWVRGDPVHLTASGLAVVGARACTGYGTQVTAELTEVACSAGATIVSGAAYGIDAVAHRTALALAAPTIAVVAGGIDRPYPAAHASLFERIAQAGVICSEVAPGTAPTRWRFLQRNRVIAALAEATLVTEAGVRSGSLNTAGHAAELSRSLGAVPGPITSAASSGCHRLIREYGAALISGGGDLLELLGASSDPARFGCDETLGPERQPETHRRVLDALPLRGARSTTDVARSAGIGEREASDALAELELLGAVARRETPGAVDRRWQLARRE